MENKLNYVKCQACKKWGWEGEHRCDRRWEAVVIEPCGDEPDFPERFCFGVDAERAALSLAADNWSNWEHPDDYEIWVRRADVIFEDHWAKFNIHVEMIPNFEASEIDEESGDGK